MKRLTMAEWASAVFGTGRDRATAKQAAVLAWPASRPAIIAEPWTSDEGVPIEDLWGEPI
jgi:hypothetical protein